MKPSHAPQDINAYIAPFPPPVRALLQQIRDTIAAAAPGATEKISYGIPTFALQGNLVHFAAFKAHIGFYPGASGVAAFAQALAGYDCSRGTVRFALDQPLPLALITRIVRYRVQQNLVAAAGAGRKARVGS